MVSPVPAVACKLDIVLPGQNNCEEAAVGADGNELTFIVTVAEAAHELLGSITV